MALLISPAESGRPKRFKSDCVSLLILQPGKANMIGEG